MSATELLQKIESLPESERQWLLQRLQNGDAQHSTVEERAWNKFSASQLLDHYAPEDAIYDQD